MREVDLLYLIPESEHLGLSYTRDRVWLKRMPSYAHQPATLFPWQPDLDQTELEKG